MSLVSILLMGLYKGDFTLMWYVIITLMISALVGFAIISRMDSRFILAHTFILFIALRLIFFAATEFNALPFGDTYWDLGVVKTFQTQDSISPIEEPLFPARMLAWYSSWPVLHTIEMIGIELSGSNLFYFHMTFAIFLSGATFLFGYLIMKEIIIALKLPEKFLYLGLVLYAVSPEAIFWGLSPTRQLFGWFIFSAITFLLLRSMRERKRTLVILALFFTICLVFTHHFTSLVAIAALSMVTFLFPRREFRGMFIISALVMGATTLLWWDNYADIIWEAPTFDRLISDPLEFDLGNLRITSYPEELNPLWLVTMLRIRDILLYAPAILGAFLVFKMRKMPQVSLLLILTFAAALLVILNLSIKASEPIRILLLFIPNIAILAAVSYISLNRFITKAKEAFVLIPVISFIVFSSFLGLWGHDYGPMHLYDNSIRDEIAGEHNIHDTGLASFVGSVLVTEDVEKIISEDSHYLILILPESQYHKIRSLAETTPLNDGKTVIISTNDLYTYRYYAAYFAGIDPKEQEQIKAELQDRLEQFDLVYSDGNYKVWR